MSETTDQEMLELGWKAAEQVAGPGVAEAVNVRGFMDSSDQFGYIVSYLIENPNAAFAPGRLNMRLSQFLREELRTRHDPSSLLVEIYNREDWPKRYRA